MEDKQEIRLRELSPRDEIELLIREATASVEADLALEDAGWISLSAQTGDVITEQERITNLKLSRLYAVKDPLGKQSIRLWTDYTFGSGMSWSVDEKEDKTKKVMEEFWDSKENRKVLGAAGQRRSSDKLLIDGSVPFAIFLGAGGKAIIRRIDPLEITEIITDQDDKENILFYKRAWTDSAGTGHTAIYRSSDNIKNVAGKDNQSNSVTSTETAVIYRITYNDNNPLLLPALTWMKYYTRFLSSRIAVMLALAKFAWRTKVAGGQVAVDAIKAKTEGKEVNAGSQLLENMGSDTTPIKTDTGAGGAYQDGRMIKLQIAAAVGIPEQYYGDISIGNLATAKTVELPMMKMFTSYQKVWEDAYKDINEIILEHNKVPPDKWYVDMDFPPIAPEDVLQAATSIVQILGVFPEFASSPDVQQIAMMTLGINDPAEALEQIAKEAKINPSIALTKALKQLRESLKVKE